MIQNSQNNILTYPIDRDNEGLLIANALKNSENREIFYRKVTFDKFRVKEFQTIAWGIIETINSKIEFNLDAVLLKSKSCPARYIVEYAFLQEISNNFEEVATSNYLEHIERLSVDCAKHQLIDFATRSLLPACTNPITTMADLENRITHAKSILVKGSSALKLNFKSMATVAAEYDEMKALGIDKRTTGFSQLDFYLTEGFKEKQITTVAGISSVGKSSLALTFMKNLSQLDLPVPAAQFALEMNNMSLFTKLLAFKSRIPINRLVKKPEELTDQERAIYFFEKEQLAKNSHIFLDDTPARSIDSMREQILLLQDHIKQGYIVVVIDLYGKIGDLQSSDNFARDYEKNLNKVQIMTRELGIHTILVAQINREIGKKKNKRPTMNDLKNSGALTEISDLMLGIHRPYNDSETSVQRKLLYNTHEKDFDDEEEYHSDNYNKIMLDDNLDANLAEIIILKQRMGPKDDIVNCIFDPDTTCFCPISESYQKKINQRRLDEEAVS